MKIDAGFTLFEILLVLALGAAITVVGAIGLSQLQTIFRLRSSGDEIRALIQLGRENTLANKDSAIYGIALSNGIFRLMKNSTEESRFQIPAGVVITPPSAIWNFARITGKLGTCAPCLLTLSSLGNSEIITIDENGMVY